MLLILSMCKKIEAFSWLPQGQEKSEKKRQKSGKLRKFDITIKKKYRYCQLKLTKFLIFQSLQMVKIK